MRNRMYLRVQKTTEWELGQVGPFEQAVEELVLASRVLTGIAVRSIARAAPDVTVPQHRLLMLLAARGPQTVNELANELGVDQSNASRQCARLERRHLIERQRSVTDGRAVLVSVTADGRDVLAEVDAERRRQISSAVQTMEGDKVQDVAIALGRFNQAVGEETNNIR